MARMEIISGVERRRRWSKEAKLEILAEADRPGVRIGDVARRHDIYPAQIRLWRQTLSHFEASTSFLPVQLVDEVGLGQPPVASPTPVFIEISLRNGRGLKVPADIERKTLASLIACVEAA
ncbi:transposase [Ensifer adhaerens]|uniref:IS66-like element accessory protein TnpA n=2 Tax=Ensifer adhaerens TaxID=106592 RepID=UPI001CBE0D6F|nr:transposase [Ensifer adhaerens]MBZ7924883.1 transposase [Ensifer adhaerens]UAX95107.1 transposase [Ensifer adhaerens]UAX95902.1 transposase [Ensifer adhaerens]UAX96530.1 transposase [Ensifer adhaerens]UAY03001.1 transposase [Ensifer adhaerens]